MTSEAPVPAYRRNGKIPSCEPCRISKLRCDHEKPGCRRCRQRRKQCVYHPAPMTKRPAAAPSSPRRPAVPSQQSGHSPYENANANVNANPIHAESRVARPTEGYLGGTSFMASLAESQQSIHEADDEAEGAHLDPEINRSYNCVYYDNNKIEQGVNVLKLLLMPLPAADDVFELRRASMCTRTPLPILGQCWQSLRAISDDIDIGRRAAAPDTEQQQQQHLLRELSRTLFDNTAKPLALPGSASMQEYALSFTGRLIRWESVGVVVSALTLFKAAREMCKRNALEELSRPPSWKALIEASNACLSFCDDLGSINDVLLWMLGENTIVQTLFHGDASYPAWKRIGDVSSCIYALGLHQRIHPTPSVPRWLAEIRKHNISFAYTIDKMLAVFVGRPPRISRRYVVLDVPLSIDESLLELPAGELEAEIARRGDAVYAYEDIRQYPTLAYANHRIMLLREEILELFLGMGAESVRREQLVGAIDDISRRSKQQWDTRPACLRYDPTAWNTARPPDECYSLMTIELDHIYNDWLLQRVIVQRLHGDCTELLRLSDKMLSDGLAAVTQGGGDIGWNYCDLPWSIVLFCLPAAGVLVLELLRQTHHTHTHTDPSAAAFCRSRAIQNLSILVSSLEWIVRPGIGNYELCRQARAMLTRSLDRILDPARRQHASNEGGRGAAPRGEEEEEEANNLFAVADANANADNWMEGFVADPGMEFWSNLEDHSLMMFNSGEMFWPRNAGVGQAF